MLCYLVHLFLQSSCSPKKKKLFLSLGRVLTKYVCSLAHLSTVTQSSGEKTKTVSFALNNFVLLAQVALCRRINVECNYAHLFSAVEKHLNCMCCMSCINTGSRAVWWVLMHLHVHLCMHPFPSQTCREAFTY